MDFVDEQHVSLLQVGEQGGQVTGTLQRRAGGDAEIDPHLVGDDGGKGGFTQTGGAVQQDVVQCLPAELGGVDVHRQIFLHLFLTDVIPQTAGAQGVVPIVLRQIVGGHQAVFQIHIHGNISFACSV